MNDACMQALGSYEGGRMLYLGLGTSMGTTFIIDHQIVPLALGHLKFCGGESFEHYLSRKGLELHGVKRWRRAVCEAAITLKDAFLADYVVLGGGNAKKMKEFPKAAAAAAITTLTLAEFACGKTPTNATPRAISFNRMVAEHSG